jgi:glycosyltransferase involved in cell wall biosynthesis
MELKLKEDENYVPTLCLNMIVKNESKIIKRLLDSVVNVIDTYCICDTGSTDNTVELIQQYFQEKNIPGIVIYEPFKDFGYNRTFALDACNAIVAEYILLLDADMVFGKTTIILSNK